MSPSFKLIRVSQLINQGERNLSAVPLNEDEDMATITLQASGNFRVQIRVKGLKLISRTFTILLETIHDSSTWFCDKEWDFWEMVLLFSDCPHATDIIYDCKTARNTEQNLLAKTKISDLIAHLT